MQAHASTFPPIRGVILDMDGTVAESRLDFARMRREMGIPGHLPILETLATYEGPRAAECWEILHRHESRGASTATVIHGVEQFLAEVHRRKLPVALFTRNSRAATEETLERLQLEFELVLAREDALHKPHPDGIYKICQAWGIEPRQAVLIGDGKFDIQTAHNAGCRAVVYTRQRDPQEIAHSIGADFALRCFTEDQALWQWLESEVPVPTVEAPGRS